MMSIGWTNVAVNTEAAPAQKMLFKNLDVFEVAETLAEAAERFAAWAAKAGIGVTNEKRKKSPKNIWDLVMKGFEKLFEALSK